MAEVGKIRVVRCPKCEKLLPELPDYPVYRCGGCDTTLQAKKAVPTKPESSSEPIDEEKLDLSAEHGSSEVGEASEANQVKKETTSPVKMMNSVATSPSSDESEAFYAAKFQRPSKAPVGSKLDAAQKRADKEKKVKSGEEADEEAFNWRRGFDRDRKMGFRTPRAVAAEGVELSHVGPSNYVEAQASSQAMYLEQDRAEILRKIDELRNQLARSTDMVDKPPRHVAPVVPPPPSSYAGGHVSADARGAPFYRSRYDPDYYHPHGDPYIGSQMLRRGPYHSHGHFYGIDDDPMLLYPHGALYDQPPCSCLACRNEHLQVPYRVPKPAVNQMLHPVVGRPTGGYNHRRGEGALFNSHVRNPSALEYDSSGGVVRRLLAHRSVDAKGNARMCLPVHGAAPFVTCSNCFELLQLATKMERNVKKLRCGCCCELITLKFDDKRVLFSVHAQAKPSASQVNYDSGEVDKEDGLAPANVGEKVALFQ